MGIDIIGWFLGLSLGQRIDISSAVIFVILLGLFLLINKKKIALQKIVFPLLYIILYRTKIGIKFMDKIATRYREHVKLFGYAAIGLGFFGMLYISLGVLFMFIRMVFRPELKEPGISLVLPFTNVPGIGYLSFWHWIIAIFILAVIHEFAHGVVARAHGLKIKSSGFAVFGVIAPILPAAFVEPDEKVMNKQKDIVQYSVFAAGPIINIIFALILIMLLPYTADMTGGKLAPFEDTITEPVGLSFNILNESYPAAKAGLQDGMIISAINGKPVDDYTDFAIQLMRIKPNQEIIITADEDEYSLTTAVHPDNEELAFLGIVPLKNERRIVDDYADIAPMFYWFRGLFKWLFLLNLFIGLANLLPLGIVDGGRMLKIALDKTVRNKAKAKQIWGTIAIAFLLILVFGLITSYLGNPFALLP